METPLRHSFLQACEKFKLIGRQQGFAFELDRCIDNTVTCARPLGLPDQKTTNDQGDQDKQNEYCGH